jgi:hypothetical protein
MSRITEVLPVALLREAVAPRTEIIWNPIDPQDPGIVRFEIADIVTEKDSGTLVGLEAREDNSVVAISIAEVMNLTLDTAAGPVSGTQVAAYIKALFDKLYVDRFPAT